MRPLRSFARRNYVTLAFCAVALLAFLGSGLYPASGSKAIPTLPGEEKRFGSTLPNGATLASISPLGARRGERSDALEAKLRPASRFSPFATTLTATKTDNISTPVNPGDTIMYTVEITNTGAMDATNVNFTDTIDANTTLVPGSVAVAPIAVNDAYNTIGNVNMTIPVGQGVIANDLKPNGSGTLAVTMVNATAVPGTAATTNGSVTMAADGSYTYAPNAGFSGPTDTFTYTLGNSATPGKTDTATVTITVSGRIWFVNSGAGVNGDGRLNTPFNILTGAGSADSVDAANDVIFLYSSGTNYTGGITLNSAEKVIGQGASQSILTITGFTAPSGTNLLPATGGANPVITTVGTTAITLGLNNGLHGFTVGDTGAAGTDISGTSFGTLTAMKITLNGTGRALNLATGTMAAGSTFDLIESNGGSPAEGARLNTVGGSFTATTTNIVNPTGTGVDVQSAPAGTSFNFGGTTVNKGASAGTGVNLASNAGTFSFSSLAVTTSNGTGVSATSSGTVNVTTGSIAATGGPALVSNPTTLGMTFTSVSSTNSTTTGISLTSASGSLSIGTTTITNPTGIGISVNTSSATLNFGATTSTQSGGTGVSLTSNTGTITFGALNASPDAGQKGLVATENTNTITTTSGSITASTNTAVEITKASGATPLVVSLTSVSANGGASGIVLTNTSGSFTIVGDGTNTNNGSGGIIQNTTSAGISLTTVQNISLTAVNIHDIGRSGIDGQGVVNFTMARSTINNVGTAAAGQYEESNIAFNDGGLSTSSSVSGTVSITQSTLTNARRHGIQIENGSGTITNLTISNNTITSSTNAAVSLGTAVLVLIQGSASTASNLTTGTISSNTINNFPSAEGIAVLGGIGSATNNTSTTLGANGTPINITNNTINGGATRMGSNAIRVSFNGQFGVSNFNISNNPTLTNFQGLGISAFFGGTVTGTTTINNNVVVSNQTIGAGSSGIGVQADDGPDALGTADPDVNITINNNTVSANEGTCIRGIVRATNRATMDLTIQNNAVTAPTLANRNGIRVDSGSAAGDTNLCLLMTGNTSAGSGVNQGIGIRKQGTTSTVNVFGIIGLAPSPTTGANAAAKVAADNPAGGGVDVLSGDNFVNCTQTASPMFGSSSEESQQPSGVQDGTTDDAVDSVGRDGTLKAHHGEIEVKDDVQKISQQELVWMAQQAIQRFREAIGILGEDLGRLERVTFELADLPAGHLAAVVGTTVKIDESAAGYGWYFDQTPTDDSEFDVPVLELERQTTEYSPAFGKMDLMTVLMRELGTVYLQGKDRTPKKLRPVMNPLLLPGVRRVPMFHTVDRSTSSLHRPGASDSAGAVAAATPDQRKPDSSTSLLDLKAAVFNPSDALMPGSYASSATRMSYSSVANSMQSKEKPTSGETVNQALGTIPPGKKAVIMFSVTVDNPVAAGTTQVCNQGSVSADSIPSFLTDDPDVAGANDPTCTQLNVADLAVTKTDTPDPVNAGGNITYTVNFVNNGPIAGQNVTVTDAVPANTTFVSAVVTTGTGWGTSAPAVGGTGNIVFSKAAVANAETAVFTIVVKVNSNTANGTTITNSATAATTTPNPTANDTGTATTTVQAQADLAVTKTGLPTPNVNAGADITYTINFVNNGPSDAQTVTVTDAVPANTTFVSAVVTTGSGWAISAPAVGGTGNIVFSKATVAAGETAVFTVVVNVNASAPNATVITNNATAASATTDPTPGNNTGTAMTTVIAMADVAVTKTDTPDPVLAGNNITYTVNFVNNGPAAASTVTVTDATPANTTFVSAAVTTGTGWGVTAPAVGGTGNIVFSKASVPNGETAVFTIVVKVNSNMAGGTTITNTATAATANPDPTPGNNTGTATTTVDTQADLAVTKTDSPDPVSAGANITYTVNFVNNGPSDAQTVTVTDAVPANCTFVSASVTTGTSWNVNAPAVGATGDVVFSKGTVAAGESAVFSIVLHVNANTPSGATITNSAVAASATTDQTPGNNTGTAITTVQTQADIAVTKTDSPDPVVAGANLTYTINFANNGPSDAQTVTVTDAVPASSTFVSAVVTTGSGWSVSAPAVGATGNVVFSKASVTASETAVFTIVVKVNSDTASGATVTNTAVGASATTDPTPGNNAGTAATTVQTQADLAVVKTDSPDPVAVSQNLTYTINFVNNGPSDAQTVTVTDPMPPNTTFVSASVMGKKWLTSTPAVGGTGTITFSKASVAAGETAVFTIVLNVNLNTPNNTTLTNTATAASATADPTPGNNSSTTTTLVLAQADLALTKSNAPDPACVGEDIVYTVSLINNGPGPGINTTVTDAVPANTTFVSAMVTTGSGWSVMSPALGGTGNVVFSKASVGIGETAVFQITVKVSLGTMHGTTITNTAAAASAIPDPAPGNNTAMASTTVDPIPPTITCPATITTKAANPGDPCVIVNYPPPAASDNCPGVGVVCVPPSGSCFPLGSTAVTCTATDLAGNAAACSFTVTVFDLCLQDDGNPDTTILINSMTGDYRFCCNGVTYTGRGTITRKGSLYTLEHNAADRRVLIKDDESVHKGSGSIQAPPGTTRCTITDRNTQNNSCACQ
jgi:uncharacterized repeat protein (TIGR01451 family)